MTLGTKSIINNYFQVTKKDYIISCAQISYFLLMQSPIISCIYDRNH